MVSGGLRRLLEPQTAECRWLGDPCLPLDRKGQVATGPQLLAAMMRIDFTNLIGRDTLYLGGDGDASLVDVAMSSSPARLEVAAEVGQVTVSLRELALTRGGYRETVDWTLRVDPSLDDRTVTVSADDEIRTNGSALSNEDLFVRLRAAVLASLATPPVVVTHDLQGPPSDSDLFETSMIEHPAPASVATGLPKRVSGPTEVVQQFVSIAEIFLDPHTTTRLKATDAWPLWELSAGASSDLIARSPLALRVLGTILKYIIQGNRLSASDMERFVSLYTGLSTGLQVRPGAGNKQSMAVKQSSRHLPVYLGGLTHTGSGPWLHAAAWHLEQELMERTIGRWKFAKQLTVAYRLAGSTGGSRYSFGPASNLSPMGPVIERKVKVTNWSVGAWNGPKEGELNPTFACLFGMNFLGSSEALPRSDALLDLLDSAYYSLRETSPTGVQLAVVDRDS